MLKISKTGLNKMLKKQPFDNTGSNHNHYRHLAFGIIRTLAIALATQGISHRVIAQPASPQTISPQTISQSTSQTNSNNNLSVEAVANHLEGIMSTTAQAESDPNFVGVQMTTCRIDVSEPQPDSIYLYQEQALTESLNAPYRQRFLQINPGENNRIQSLTFKPENNDKWIGFCNQANRNISSTEIGEPACTVSLRIASIGGFVGSTPTGGCAANVRGAVTITNVVVLHDRGMDTWDRGFDAEGNRVWGAQDTPYQYRRDR